MPIKYKMGAFAEKKTTSRHAETILQTNILPRWHKNEQQGIIWFFKFFVYRYERSAKGGSKLQISGLVTDMILNANILQRTF